MKSLVRVDQTAAPDRLRFTGEYQDPTGLYHLRARQYAPDIARFQSRDAWPAGPNDPYVSTYAYVNNRPTLFVDPSGLFCVLGHNADGSCRGSGVVGAIGGAMYHAGSWAWEHKWQIASVGIGGACIVISFGSCALTVAAYTGTQTFALGMEHGLSSDFFSNAACGIFKNGVMLVPGMGAELSGMSGVGKVAVNAHGEMPGIVGSVASADWASPGCGLGMNSKS